MSEPQGPKTRYKTTNWASYNAALKARGSLTIWLDEDMQWYAPAICKRGRQRVFSDAAIQFCLGIKCLFSLALRQSLGLIQSLLHFAGLDWRVPDFSTISRRQRTLQVNCLAGAVQQRWIFWWTARASSSWVRESGSARNTVPNTGD